MVGHGQHYHRLAVAAVAVALAGCGGVAPVSLPPTATASVLSTVPRAWAVASVGCALVDGAGGVYGGAVEWSGVEPPHANALAFGDVDGDGIGDLVEATSPEPSRVMLRRGLGPCRFAAPIEIAPGRAGLHRHLTTERGRVLVTLSETTDTPARVLTLDGERWTETAAPALRRPSRDPFWISWFYAEADGATLAGLDSGDGWISPAAPEDSTAFASVDPMALASLTVDGERRWYVSGLPRRSLLLAHRGDRWIDTGDEVTAGPDRAVSWGAHVWDADGDGADDLLALTLEGRNASDGRPRAPRLLVQRGGRFVEAVWSYAPRLYATALACFSTARRLTCLAHSGNEDGQAFEVLISHP